MRTLRDAIIIVAVGTILGLGVNSGRNALALKGLPLSTPWPDNRRIVQLEVPPSYQPGDSLISLEDAYNLYLGASAIFVDAREQSEFESGHIKGAVNLPFEEWDGYWDNVRPRLDPEREIVAYCEGLDCEQSVFLARELKRMGYDKTYIFFGGWLKWKEAGLPISAAKNG